MNSRARGRFGRGGDADVGEDQREQLMGQAASVASSQGLAEESMAGPAAGLQRAVSRGKAESKFYRKQLDRVYSSNISIQGRPPADIVTELNQKAESMEVVHGDGQALAAIKTEEAVVPDLIAKDVADEINSSVEFKSLDQLKEFL